MLGSIDCCKWKWKNCATALHGQYEGKEAVPAVTLEAIADDTLWIWHSFFGMPGSANDINSDDLFRTSLRMGYTQNGHSSSKTVSHQTTPKEVLLANHQEACRKDVERAFGVLQARWHILARPSRFWYKSTMATIMRACIVMHNMMVEE
eukprot:IDg3341t1